MTLAKESVDEVCLCPLEGVMDVIARKWSLFVINAVGNEGTVRFNRIMERLPGISPTTLSETLEKLVGMKILNREAYAETPPRVEYSLTKDGLSLREAVVPLLVWAARTSPEKGDVGPTCPVVARVPLKRKP